MRIAILLFGLLAFVGPAALAAADGLERFEKDLKPRLTADGTGLSYRDAKALGPSGFVLGGVVLTQPPGQPGSGQQGSGGPSRLTIDRLTVEDVDFDRIAAGLAPGFLRLRAEGIKADENAAGSDLDDLMKSYDLPNVPVDLLVAYRHDGARQVFSLDRLELIMPGLARLEIGLTLDGVATLDSPPDDKAREALEDAVTLRTASLTYDDASLLRRVLTAAARETGQSPDALAAHAAVALAALAADQPGETTAVIDALVSFIQDWRQPAGPIRATVNPPANVGMADSGRLTVPNAIKEVFGLSVSYGGTRAGAAARLVPPAPAAAPQPAAPTAAAPTAAAPTTATTACTAGTRLFLLAAEVWWPATAREPLQGDRCVVRFDGENDDEIASLAPGTALPWSVDGPGSPATACRRGDRVLVHDDGAWYRGQVKADAGRDRPCPVRYVGDFADEEVPLGQIRMQ